MNNGVPNEAVRCFRRLIESFAERARAANPGLKTPIAHVQPRNLGEVVPRDVDMVVSSGGPGSPHDGYDQPWADAYRAFIDSVVERNLREPTASPSVFAVCHSFEICVLHFGIAKMQARPDTKFGLMPAYITPEGMRSELFERFGDRLFAFEHRGWEAVDLQAAKLRKLGGSLLATESRPGRSDKGKALLAFEFAPGIVGTQFHPEGDKPGVIAWITRPEMAQAFKRAYGEALYERMMKSLQDSARLAQTFALLVPGWLTRRFNRLAEVRGLKPIPLPEESMDAFEAINERASTA
jgi:homoserine O-succinyltransferase/O-acetyltransferase